MDNVERAAVLLLGIGEQQAAHVLKQLEPRQVQKIGRAMTSMANLSKDEIQDVIEDFLGEAEKQTGLGGDTEEYIRKTLITALGEERGANLVDRILTNSDETGLDNLRWLDARTVADLIRNEHPQTIATVLTYLDSEQAAEVIAFIPEDRRVDLVMRMSAIDSVKPEALSELGTIIEQNLTGLRGGKSASIGGLSSVADLINYLDSSIESQVLEGIATTDNDLCESIKEKMFVFGNLVDVDGRSIQTLLREVSSEVLMLALKGADERVKEKIFENMSKRAAELMRDDLEAQGPVKVSEVEAAQKEILATARRMADSGEIALGSKGGEEMI